jgi:hypothetical protein
VLVEGPAGSGKTRPICEWLHEWCINRPNIQALMVRKTERSLTGTALKTFRNEVIDYNANNLHGMTFPNLSGIRPGEVKWYGGSAARPAAFEYSNGSTVTIGGMDNPTKFLSGAFDIIYVNEAIELTEEDVDTLRTRLRGTALNHPRLVMDTNPSYSTHWLNKACDEGTIQRLRTFLPDNPFYYNEDGTMTPRGRIYIEEQLQTLKGSRRQRFLDGEWVGVENSIYPHFDRDIHIQDIPSGLRWIDGAEGVDYGRRHACGATPITVDQYGRRWVHEVWGEPADDHGANLVKQVARQMHAHHIRRGMTDPLQDVLAGNLGIDIADGSAGSRIHRTDIVGRLLNIFPQGQSVIGIDEESHPFRRKLEPLPYDSPGIIFVKGGAGIDRLTEQIESYHEVAVTSASRSDWQVARINDDYVAAVEYACESLEEPPRRWTPLGNNSISKPVTIGPSVGTPTAPPRTWGELVKGVKRTGGKVLGSKV